MLLLFFYRYGPNILLNSIEGYQRPSVWQCLCRVDQAGAQAAVLRDFDNSIVSGFQLATLSGPMCEEPLMGVCFSVERWDIQSQDPPQNQDSVEQDSTSHNDLSEGKVDGSVESYEQVENTAAGPRLARRRPETASADCYRPVSGQLIAAMKEACRQAFQAQPQRLMAAMYTCEIMATAEVLGKKVKRQHNTIFLSTLIYNQHQPTDAHAPRCFSGERFHIHFSRTTELAELSTD